MRNRREDRGFTLIEMLISLAIVAAIVTMVYGSYTATSRGVDLHTSRMASFERAQLVLRLMARQIRCAYLPPSDAGHGRKRGPSEPGDSASSPMRFQGNGYKPQGRILSFATTRGFELDLHRPAGLARIAYQYDRVGGTLSMACDEPGLGDKNASDPDHWRPVLAGIQSVELAFHDGSDWQPQWDSRISGRLPRAVRIAFTLVDRSGREHQYGTAIPLPSRAIRRPLRGRRSVAP